MSHSLPGIFSWNVYFFIRPFLLIHLDCVSYASRWSFAKRLKKHQIMNHIKCNRNGWCPMEEDKANGKLKWKQHASWSYCWPHTKKKFYSVLSVDSLFYDFLTIIHFLSTKIYCWIWGGSIFYSSHKKRRQISGHLMNIPIWFCGTHPQWKSFFKANRWVFFSKNLWRPSKIDWFSTMGRHVSFHHLS